MLNLNDKKPKDEAPAETVDGVARFSSHPIAKYRMGDYEFVNGLLELPESEADAFRELLASMPLSESHRVKELDVSAAEAQVRAILANQGGATKQIDSSVGDRAPSAAVGEGVLGES